MGARGLVFSNRVQLTPKQAGKGKMVLGDANDLNVWDHFASLPLPNMMSKEHTVFVS